MRNKLCFLFFLLSLFVTPFVAIAQQSRKIYLSGTGADRTVDWDFLCSDGRKSGKWTKIAVPSCWEQQGFGMYNYGLDDFKKRLNETGTYRHKFTVPEAWKDMEIQLVFEGVMTDARVKINNKLVGPVHQGAFYEFRYDVTQFLKTGNNNELEVFVQKHSEDQSINEAERKADFWIFGGIFRPVYLEVKPKINIQRVAVDAKADGTFLADVYLSNHTQASTVEVKLSPLPLLGVVKGKEATLSAKVTNVITRLSGKISSVLAWNPETPYRYRATFSLLSNNGKLLHQYTEIIGFRTIEVKEADGIYVNGARIKMKGVNRHTFHPKYGRTSSKQLSIQDVNTIKDMNMNAVRMSHYPPEKHFLDACDSLGLFVLDELTGWQKPPYDLAIGKKLVKELIVRDVNHPSIILWDNGNEGGWNDKIDNDFEELDIQKREVLHPWQNFRKTNTLHYIGYNYLAHDDYSRRNIFFPTEFLHGLYDGGSGASLDDYWEKMWGDPLCTGGFLWAYADESLARTDFKDSLDTDGNHAPDGIVGPYLEKEGSYFTIKEVWSPLHFEKRYITPNFDGTFRVENRFTYTNLSACKIESSWIKFSGPNQPLKSQKTNPELIKIALEPGQNGILRVKLPPDWKNYDALYLTVIDPFGRTINTWTWPVKTPAQKSREIIAKRNCENLTLQERSDDYLIKTCSLSLSFDKKAGIITAIDRNGIRIPLTNGPVILGAESVIKNVLCKKEGDTDVYIAVSFENGSAFNWRITANGLVHLDLNYKPTNSGAFSGISFDFPEQEVKAMRWLGNGPYRVYKNRMKGVNFGVWEKAYNNTITGESGFNYPEFKGYHAETYWAELLTHQNNGFKVYIESNDIFFRTFTPPTPNTPGQTLITYPKGDISFLHNINAIGTKTQTPQGPQASPYTFNAEKIYGGMLNLKITFDFTANDK